MAPPAPVAVAPPASTTTPREASYAREGLVRPTTSPVLALRHRMQLVPSLAKGWLQLKPQLPSLRHALVLLAGGVAHTEQRLPQ